MKQNISTEATLVLLNTLLNEAAVSARRHCEKILPDRSLRRNRHGEAKAKRRDAFRFLSGSASFTRIGHPQTELGTKSPQSSP